MASMKTTVLAVAAASAAAASNVSVQFFGESGCPDCMAFISGALKTTFAAEGVPGIIDFKYIPWGNAYFVTSECGGAGYYDRTARQCFDEQCGPSATSPPADCFTGDVVCQHGKPECLGNRVLNCANSAAAGDAAKVLPFLNCLEDNYASAGSDSFWTDLASRCASTAGIDAEPLLSCYNGPEGTELVVQSAKSTPPHPGVPYVLVNGQALDNPDDLLQAVCAAYTGTKPAGCGTAAAPSNTYI